MESAQGSPYISAIPLSTTGRDSPVIFAPNSESEEWLREWRSAQAKDLIDSPIIAIDAETTVEEACDVLLSNNAVCVAIKATSDKSENSPYLGLFDFADVNAFLTLAATQHTFSPESFGANPRADEIVNAARAGRVPVRLVSNLSEKNPLEALPNSSSIVDLLGVFASGAHRILIRSDTTAHAQYLGYVTDRALLAYFHSQASVALSRFLANQLHSLALPSLSLRSAVVYCTASAPVLDAMRLMSEQGVSSVAVVEDNPSAMATTLLSAISVTDIGKIVVPSQSKYVLQTPLQQFVAQIKEPDGSMDGADRYPVYSVSAASSLRYTIEKILATNAHRVFIIEDPSRSGGSSPIGASAPSPPPNTSMVGASSKLQLRGVVSVVDGA
ncbi:hypothetical protein DFH11DRAFT_1747479 [Phellopilus nigrolimitatus]|nr:hypothetical protein DFH11DRAFT_1747479 [Phellopilus nigrolimitatus]